MFTQTFGKSQQYPICGVSEGLVYYLVSKAFNFSNSLRITLNLFSFESQIHTHSYTPQHGEDPEALGCSVALWQQSTVFHNAEHSTAQQSRDSCPPGSERVLFVSHVTG